jgi:hypothetical protein
MAEVTAISWTQGVGTVVTSLMAISKQHLDTCALTAVNASGTAACNQSHSHSHVDQPSYIGTPAMMALAEL